MPDDFSDLGGKPAVAPPSTTISHAPKEDDFSDLGGKPAAHPDGQPGANAVGSMGPGMGFTTPANDLVNSGIEVGKNTLGLAAKIANAIRSQTSGPVIGQVIKAATGKDVYSGKEQLNSLNPTNTQTFPSTNDMLTRAGVDVNQGIGSKVLPSVYAEPGSQHPWYQPEKNGMLDPSVAQAGTFTDMVTDPASWIGVGEGKMARDALESPASREALQAALKDKQGMLGKIISGASGAADTVTNAAAAPAAKVVDAIPGASAVGNVLNMPTNALKAWGKKLYGSLVEPVENQGAKYGKQDVASTLYDAGIKTPANLTGKAAEAGQVLGDARNKILTDATDAGGVTSMESAVSGLRDEIQKIRASADPQNQPIADALEAKLNEYTNLEKGTPATPGVPPTTGQVPTGILDSSGNSITKEAVTVPGKPPVPGTPGIAVTPTQASGFKTSLYNNLSPGTFKEVATQTSLGNRLRASLANGMKTEVENSVGQTLGDGAKEDLTDLNDSWGKLLGTKQGQVTAENQGNRLANRIVTPTGSDAVIGSLGMMENPQAAMTGVIAKHAADAVRYLAMPAGYGMQKIADDPTLAPLLNAWGLQKFKQVFGNIDQSQGDTK